MTSNPYLDAFSTYEAILGLCAFALVGAAAYVAKLDREKPLRPKRRRRFVWQKRTALWLRSWAMCACTRFS